METLEVPESWVCAGEAFQWFVAHLLSRLPQFRAVYNAALREYRRLHHVRSLSHPAPDLAEDGTWSEAPLWVWTADDPRRRRLFAALPAAKSFSPIADRGKPGYRSARKRRGPGRRAARGASTRQRANPSRALMTTLWARLALGDLFIHGIGGAKYDRVTDLLMERFFGLCRARLHGRLGDVAPAHRTGTCPGRRCSRNPTRNARTDLSPRTILDRWGGKSCLPRELRRSRRTRMSALPGRVDCLQAEVDRDGSDSGERAVRCHAIRQINAGLQTPLEHQRRRLIERQAEMAKRLRAEGVLAWREYAFCLYPEPTLREFLSRLLEKSL